MKFDIRKFFSLNFSIIFKNKLRYNIELILALYPKANEDFIKTAIRILE